MYHVIQFNMPIYVNMTHDYYKKLLDVSILVIYTYSYIFLKSHMLIGEMGWVKRITSFSMWYLKQFKGQCNVVVPHWPHAHTQLLWTTDISLCLKCGIYRSDYAT